MADPITRSTEMVLVAYFLARCGVVTDGRRYPAPPARLRAAGWAEAYSLFYKTLGATRTAVAFHNSLKNSRDSFDAHIGAARVGWRDVTKSGSRPPAPLPDLNGRVLLEWGKRTDDELWTAVQRYVAV